MKKNVKYASERLSQKLMQAFVQPYSKEVIFDHACQLICQVWKSASVALLIYDGLDDCLKCSGRNVNPKRIKLTTNGDAALQHIFDNIHTYEFIYSKINDEEGQAEGISYRSYKLYFGREAILQNDFNTVHDTYKRWKDTYEKVKYVFRKEQYEISSDQSERPTISGSFFYNLVRSRNRKVQEYIIRDLESPEVDTGRNFCIRLLKEINVDVNHQLYYLGLPLKSKERYFGILRLLMPKKNFAHKQTEFEKWFKENKTKLFFLSSTLSLQIENQFYSRGYQKLSLLTSQLYIKNNDQFRPYLSGIVKKLSKIVNCKGGLARINLSGYETITVGSKGTKGYMLLLEQLWQTAELPLHFKEIVLNLFELDKDLIAIGVPNCFDYPVKIIKYYFSSEKIIYKWDKTAFEKLPSGNENYSEYYHGLLDLHIEKIIFFRIPECKNSYFTFFNSRNYPFILSDVELLYYGIRQLGIEIKKHFGNRQQKQMKLISDLHVQLNAFINREQHRLLRSDNIIRKYREKFYEILDRTIDSFGFFHGYIIWECVSEISPQAQDFHKFIFKRKVKRNAEYNLENSITCQQIGKYSQKTIKKEDFQHLYRNYFNGEVNKQFISLALATDFDYFDIPIFSDPSANEDQWKFALNGLITLIYKKKRIREEYDDYIHTREFALFVKFFSRQLSFAWNRLLDGITESLKIKISNVSLELTQRSKVPTIEDELHEIAKILTEEFTCTICMFYLTDAEEKNLEFIASNLPNLKTLPLSLEKDREALSVQAYQRSIDYRIAGRKNVQALTDNKRLELLEDDYKQFASTDKIKKHYKTEHWLTVVIKHDEDRKRGLIKLFQIPAVSEGIEDDTIISDAFSEFETNLLRKVQFNIFHIIEDYKILGQTNRLLRNMVHQVVSPLNALNRHCSNLRRWGSWTWDENKIKDRLRYISILSEISAQRARSFETVFKLEDGTLVPFKKQIYDLRLELVNKAIDYQPMAKSEKGITIHIRDRPDRVGIATDLTLFNHVFTNLIDNAVKYSFDEVDRAKTGLQASPQNPYDPENILIDLVEEENHAKITISNWGLEIKAEEFDQIYQRNYRGKYALKNKIQGTGIGLYLGKRIMELLGGSIELLPSEHPNHIHFQLILPK